MPRPEIAFPRPVKRFRTVNRRNFRFKDFFGGLLFFVAGLFFFIGPWFEKPAQDYIAFLRWTPTPCRITGAVEREATGNGIDRMVVVRCAYTFAGTPHESVWESSKNERRPATDAEIAALLSDFRPGTKTTCRVNPDTPSEMLLRADFPWPYIGFSAFASIFVTFGAILALSCFDVVRDPATWAKSPGAARRIGMAAGLLFMGIGFGISTFTVIARMKRPDVSGWVTTPCIVETAAIRRTMGGGKHSRTSYAFEACYAYEAGGKTYRSHAVRSDNASIQISDRGASMLARYAAGTRTTCLTDPADPSRSALVPYSDDRLEELVAFVFPGGFGLIGAVVFTSCLFQGKVKNSKRLQKAGALVFIGIFCAIWIVAGLTAGSVRIQGIPTDSPWAKYGFVVFGVVVAGFVLRSVWRRIEAEPEPKPKGPSRHRK